MAQDITDPKVIMRLVLRAVDSRNTMLQGGATSTTTAAAASGDYDRAAFVNFLKLLGEAAEGNGCLLHGKSNRYNEVSLNKAFENRFYTQLRPGTNKSTAVARASGSRRFKDEFLVELGWTSGASWPSNAWEERVVRETLQHDPTTASKQLTISLKRRKGSPDELAQAKRKKSDRISATPSTPISGIETPGRQDSQVQAEKQP